MSNSPFREVVSSSSGDDDEKVVKLLLDSLWTSPANFPWDVLGFTVPKFGATSSYIVDILSSFQTNTEQRLFLQGRPSLRELKRFNENNNIEWITSLLLFIKNTQEHNVVSFDRNSVAQDVLLFLSRRLFFKEYVEEQLTQKWKRGLITLPASMVTWVSKPKPQDYYR